MRLLQRLAASLMLICLVGGTPSLAEEPIFDPAQTTRIEEIVRAYLIEHPEVLKEAIAALQAKEEAAKAAQQANALSQYQDQLLSDPASPVAGNPMGDVTVIEFFDYKCPYCKKVTPALNELLETDKSVRIVFKEFPILGESSLLAARAALAAAKQGRYLEFHAALMEHRGNFDDATIRLIAETRGLDAAKLEADMKSEDVEQQIRDNHALAQAMSIRSTPTFVIGDQIIPGAVSIDDLKAIIAEVRGGA
jgi:protein-disulfide isomerase